MTLKKTALEKRNSTKVRVTRNVDIASNGKPKEVARHPA